MRNTPKSETQLLGQVVDKLSSAAPWEWSSDVASSLRSSGADTSGVDAWLTARAKQRTLRLGVELRLRFEPRDIEGLTRSLAQRKTKRTAAGYLLAAPFLSRRSQELLERAGWNYADATGNVRIALDDPPLFLRLEGAKRNPFTDTRPLRTLRGPIAGRLVRALADFRPPFGIRDLAQRSGTSPAMASRVVAILEADAIVTREGRGPVTHVDWKALLERWCEEYGFTQSNRMVRYLSLRGRKPLLDSLRKTSREYAITGGLLAERRKTVVSSVTTAIYSDDPEALARECGLEPASKVADVILAEPFDRVVFERTWKEEGLRYVALSQAAADLLTSGDRDPQSGAALIEWMEANPEVWRT